MNLNEIPLSYRGKYIQGYRCGSGSDVILLLHGAGADNALLSWSAVMERLSKRATVYAVDLPGYGKSESMESIPEEGFYPYFHHCLEAIVDQLKLNRFVLVGYSMGGAIAIRYALEHPEQVCGLVPVSSWGLSEKFGLQGLSYWCVQHGNWSRNLYEKLAKSPSLLRFYSQTFLFGRSNSCSPELLEQLQTLMQQETTQNALDFYWKSSITSKGTIPFFAEELSKLKMPILLICGKRDPLLPRSHVERASRIITNSRIHVLPSCRHWCCKEQPELLYQALWAFVKRDCLFSYNNMLPPQPSASVTIPSPTADIAPEETVKENPLRSKLRARWEQQRKARTKLRLTTSSAEPARQARRRQFVRARR